ncbi:ABC transporter substrate-binding protein [Haploplasma axanthum]|uniref:Corrinoid ABC transporter substrate-binding protein n=1 Tax=Haploplasma axanthum TaxID=29552 RepID=A0A449BFG7_HAPAX|nr:ABC transporter substrate-binding protein [Haploplasma axanthum]VEU81189.1 corrinoid ABC transporter substrate-binding protein [Haploplasma axanthum]
MKKIFIFSVLLISALVLTSCKAEKKDKDIQLAIDQIEKEANEVVINEDSVTFTDADGKSQTITKKPTRVISVYNSYTNLWYEAGGKIVGRIESETELNEDAIKDGSLNLVGKTNTTVSPELLLNANPDLVILSSSKQGKDLIPQLEQNNIKYISMEYNGLGDYLKFLKVFSFLNETDNYDKTGKKIIENIASIISKVPKENNPKALLVFGTTKTLKAYLSSTANGEMLKYLGVTNIGDSWTKESVTSIDINEEYVMSIDPEFIFVQSMSDEAKVKELFEKTYNEKWASLQAIANKKVIFLERDWYHYKPNNEYDKAFLKLAKIIYPTIFENFELK